MARPLIGLLGRKQSGKDTLARFLVDYEGFTRLAFADPLKEAALATDPLVRIEPDEIGPLLEAAGYGIPSGHVRLRYLVEAAGWDAAKATRDVRRYLQHFGVGIRALDLDFWVRTTLDKADALDGPVVLTDVRFPNEADEVEKRGGILVRVIRPNRPEDPSDLHESETALLDRVVHEVIPNTGTVDDLGIHAHRIARKYL